MTYVYMRNGKVLNRGGKSFVTGDPQFERGGNFATIADYQHDEIFVNLVSASRGFSDPADPFLNTLPQVTTDANGWPTVAFALVLPRTEDSVGTEDYLFRCTGNHSDLTWGSAVGWTFASGPTYDGSTYTTATLRAPNGAHGQPYLSFARGATNIEINRPGYAVGTTTRFYGPWVSRVTSWGTFFRTMDWQLTNHNDTTSSFSSEGNSASHRTTYDVVGDGSKTSGHIPLSWCVDFARESGCAGLWTCIKIAADDTFVTAYLTYLRDNAPANCKLIIEHANETWNSSFQQNYYIRGQVAIEVDGYHNFDRDNYLSGLGRKITDLRRTSNVTIVTLSGTKSAAYTAGVSISVLGMTGAGLSNGAHNILSTTSTTISFTSTTTGADTGNVVTGGTSMVRDLTTDLNSWDGKFDFLNGLEYRWIARRCSQISDIARTVFGNSAMHNRVCPVMMWQTNNSGTEHLSYFQNKTPQDMGYYLTAVGNGWYLKFDSSAYGGVDMRSLTTFNGNTPPSIADYLTCLSDACDGAKIGNVLDNVACTARLGSISRQVQMWAYENGCDMNDINGSPTNDATRLQKTDALFDPSVGAILKTLFKDKMRHGYRKICWYTFGNVDPNGTGNDQGWQVTHWGETSSSRTVALQQIVNETVPLSRNMITASGSTVISGKAKNGQYPADWPTGNSDYSAYAATDFTSSNSTQRYNLSFEAAGSRTLRVNTTTTGAGRSFYIDFNGTQIQLLSLTSGATENFDVSITATVGTNVLDCRPNTFCGTNVTINSITAL